jgi:TadE-like protein
VSYDNPRTMKTNEISADRGASARRSPGMGAGVLARLRARIGADGRQRGAVAVEFALIAPVLVLLTFGVIEFSSVYHDSSIAADAARAGARVGSAKATQTDFASAAASAASSAVSTLPGTVPKEVWVYKANSQGYPGGGSSFSSCSSNCIRYTYSAGSKQFLPSGGGGWNASSHQVCTQPYDEIGVYVKLQHPFVTKLFGAAMTITDHAVFRFEPVASSACS